MDSSFIARCAMRHADVVACAAFSERSADSVGAEAAAAALGVRLVTTELTQVKVEEALSAMDLPFVPTLMDRCLWCLYSIVSRSAHDSGAKVMLLGQLADELFGGYAKYVEALRTRGEEATRSMMEADVMGYAERGRVRDTRACAPWVEPRLPFESDELSRFASSIPVRFKLKGGVRKAVLRRAATLAGVPDAQAEAPKKADQYSSGVQKLVAASHF